MRFSGVGKNNGPPDHLHHVSNKSPPSVFALPWALRPLTH